MLLFNSHGATVRSDALLTSQRFIVGLHVPLVCPQREGVPACSGVAFPLRVGSPLKCPSHLKMFVLLHKNNKQTKSKIQQAPRAIMGRAEALLSGPKACLPPFNSCRALHRSVSLHFLVSRRRIITLTLHIICP